MDTIFLRARGEECCETPWNGKSWRMGGQTGKINPWWGCGYFLEPHDGILTEE